MARKKRLAVWTFGGIGTGHFSQGIPALERLLLGLSDSFEIVIYSRSPTNNGFYSRDFSLRTPPGKIYSVIGWVYLVCYFVSDHTKKKYDGILAFWGWPSGWIVTTLGTWLGIPNAIYIMGADAASVKSINFGIFHRPLVRRIAQWTYAHTHRLFLLSHYQKDQLITFGIKRPVNVIPWGVDPFQYTFQKKSPGEVLHCIHVGHLSPVKDQSTVLKAFALISEKQPSQLYILGADCLDGAMQNLSLELGIEEHVTFLDMVPYDEMPKYYKWADIMLHTSLSEGQSMALTEAAASGVLLAGTGVGLLYDLSGEGGIVVDAGDYKALAAKVLEAIKNPAEWDRYIQYAKAWSEKHTLKWTIEELKKELNNLLQRNV